MCTSSKECAGDDNDHFTTYEAPQESSKSSPKELTPEATQQQLEDGFIDSAQKNKALKEKAKEVNVTAVES